MDTQSGLQKTFCINSEIITVLSDIWITLTIPQKTAHNVESAMHQLLGCREFDRSIYKKFGLAWSRESSFMYRNALSADQDAQTNMQLGTVYTQTFTHTCQRHRLLSTAQDEMRFVAQTYHNNIIHMPQQKTKLTVKNSTEQTWHTTLFIENYEHSY